MTWDAQRQDPVRRRVRRQGEGDRPTLRCGLLRLRRAATAGRKQCHSECGGQETAGHRASRSKSVNGRTLIPDANKKKAPSGEVGSCGSVLDVTWFDIEQRTGGGPMPNPPTSEILRLVSSGEA